MKTDKSEVTLEQLLQVKRLEKPAPEFWQSFDAELKERTLRSLVKQKERWYTRVSNVVFLQARPLLPAAAAAMLMFVLFAGPMQVAENGSYATSGLASLRDHSFETEVPVARGGMNREGATFVKNVIAAKGATQGNFKKVYASQEWKFNGVNGSQMAGRGVVKKASL